MPSVYTIEGASRPRRRKAKAKLTKKCRRVKMGKRGCTIAQCKDVNNRWKFVKGTMRCR